MNDFGHRILWLPQAGSTFATRVDSLHYFVITVTMVASLIIGITAIYFLFKYARRHPGQATPRVTPSLAFEITIISVPLGFFLIWFALGYRDYVWYATPPPNTTDVYVMAKKWMWKFAYPDGPNGLATLHVPANRPVRLLLTSRDVIHSFWVPELRTKQDVLPGRYTSTWFEATGPGRFRIMCAEYCGTWHSQMRGEIIVMAPAAFDEWLANERRGLGERVDSSQGDHAQSNEEDSRGGNRSRDDTVELVGGLLREGQRIAAAQGCFKCHTVDGSPHIGPTWLDLYQRRETLSDGATVVADEAYLTDSMMDPLARLVRGFRPVMPSYRGKLAPTEVAALVELIKSLRSPSLSPTPAKEATFEPARTG
jgi:cytochrome c oxidase subunit 2